MHLGFGKSPTATGLGSPRMVQCSLQVPMIPCQAFHHTLGDVAGSVRRRLRVEATMQLPPQCFLLGNCDVKGQLPSSISYFQNPFLESTLSGDR